MYEAWKLPFGSLRAPDSGFFPLVLGLVLVLVSGVIWAPTFSSARAPAPPEAAQGIPRVGMAILALVVYALALERLGYLASTGLVMPLLLRGLGRVGWRTTLAVSVVSVVGSYVVFRWLGVPLPRGVLPL